MAFIKIKGDVVYLGCRRFMEEEYHNENEKKVIQKLLNLTCLLSGQDIKYIYLDGDEYLMLNHLLENY